MSHPADVVEWHILENCDTKKSQEHAGIHMGPFSTEEECKTVLDRLQQIPLFAHGVMEVHKKCRRREKRIRMKLDVRVSRVGHTDEQWNAQTIDISRIGARIGGCGNLFRLGEFLDVACGTRSAIFRVVWVGVAETATGGQLGLECLSPEANIWELDLSGQTEDEPLLQELAVARTVQRKLLPRLQPALETLDYYGKCLQARTVGGDYYDFLDLGPGKVGFLLADVAGKGVAAALLMANLQGSIHSRADLGTGDIAGLLTAVNEHLYRHTEPERYATLFFGCYDDRARTLAYANCGHTPPLLLRHGGEVERLEATATVVGLFGPWSCTVRETELKPGDILGIFTDGITETTGPGGQEFGENRLLEMLRGYRGEEAPAIVQRIEKDLEEFRSTEPLQDDFALIVARGK